MVLQTGNNKLERTIWPQHVLSLVPPISGQVTGTCDEECRMGVGGSGGGCSISVAGSRSPAYLMRRCGIFWDGPKYFD